MSSQARVIQMPDRSPDSVLLGRAGFLIRSLDEARDELFDALLAENAELAARASRRLSSVGWLLRDAADRRERGAW